MKQVPDRKKLRRVYLRRKAGAYSDVAIYSTLFIPACCLTGFCGTGVLINAFVGDWPSVFGMTVTTLFFAGLNWYCWKRMNESRQRAGSVPYIPPVTPNTLPADEILVRGSEKPPIAQSESLLRASQTAQETPKEELLRVSQE